MSTRRVKLTVRYDGTDFRGWAAQLGQRTVQGTLKEAVRQVSGEDVEIVGASRTDSGAHARGQVCHFDSAKPVKHWYQALNRALPLDVRVAKVELVAETFHSRFSAADRFYRYRILSDVSDPFRGRFAYMNRYVLDLDLMQQAATFLEGEHDFRAFTEELGDSVENTVRKLFSIKVGRVRNEVRVDIVGTAFLRGMMRRISGGLFEVGRGKRPLEDIQTLLSDQKHTLEWPEVLPARGLTLMEVRYGRHPRDNRLPK
ncbi:MAG: tRNA pseudouridine(38-40) synthase TruA [Fimbriimonadaceae bacterium]